MTQPAMQVMPDPAAVERQNELFDLYNNWPGDGDPDDDPEFVAQARDIMGLPPLEGSDGSAARARELDLLGVTRALGHDVTPGHDELHHWWTKGPGLALWAGSPRPWTTLRDHLLKYLPPEEATRAASRWFIEVFGFASGSDKNRVLHGEPPRGHVVGPG